MFKIECFVDDRHLATVLRSLVGVTRGSPAVTPVTNVEDGGKGSPVAKTAGGTALEQFLNYLERNPNYKGGSIRSIGEVVRGLGFHSKSAAYVAAKGAVEAKALKRIGIGSATKYERK